MKYVNPVYAPAHCGGTTRRDLGNIRGSHPNSRSPSSAAATCSGTTLPPPLSLRPEREGLDTDRRQTKRHSPGIANQRARWWHSLDETASEVYRRSSRQNTRKAEVFGGTSWPCFVCVLCTFATCTCSRLQKRPLQAKRYWQQHVARTTPSSVSPKFKASSKVR